MGIILTILILLGFGYIFRDTFDSPSGCLSTILSILLLIYLTNLLFTS
jgi:hypothetical protein